MKHPPINERPRGNGQVTTGEDFSERENDASAGGNCKAKWPFIPAWFDDSDLSLPTFRIYCHMLRSADNKTGLAWPSIKRICKVCKISKSTAIRSLKELISKGYLEKLPKDFQQSCRYRPTVPPEGTLQTNSVTRSGKRDQLVTAPEGTLQTNSVTRGNIEAFPIVSPENRNIPPSDTPIVSPEGKEGNPKKVLQRRQSKGEDLQYPFPSSAFKEAWNDWEQHRREIKKKLTPTSTKKQFAELLAMGEADSIAAINHSISKGWTGIFPANPSQPAKSPPPINNNRRTLEIKV